MLLVIGRDRVEGLHPERLLGDRAFDRSVIFPICLKPHATDRTVEVAAINQHVAERRRDRLWRCTAILKLGKPDQHIDEQGLRLSVVRIVIGAKVKIRPDDRALGARHTEQFGQSLQQCGLARSVRPDHRRDLRRQFDLRWRRAKATEVSEGDAFDEHGASDP